MNLHTWWLFVATVFVVSAIPGPNMLLVMTHGARHGLRRSTATMAGCMTALVAMLSVSAAGLGVFLEAWPAMFDALRFAGAAYLIYLGVKAWRARRRAVRCAIQCARRGRGAARGPFGLGGPGVSLGALSQRLSRRGQQSEGDPVRRRAAAAVHRRFRADAAAVRHPRRDVRGDRGELVHRLRVVRHADRRDAAQRERREGVQSADGRPVRRLRRDDGARAALKHARGRLGAPRRAA